MNFIFLIITKLYEVYIRPQDRDYNNVLQFTKIHIDNQIQKKKKNQMIMEMRSLSPCGIDYIYTQKRYYILKEIKC